MAVLPKHVVDALNHGPQAEPTLTPFEDAVCLLDEGYQQTENGSAETRDGGIEVAVRTDLPGVTPAMWSWWFGWHGSDPRRYKLWHPRAHVSAQWTDDSGDGGFLGRASEVKEYLGSAFTRAAIRFIEPSAVGLQNIADDEVAICARLGSSDLPVDVGWLVHYVRPTPDGAEMRSRFWMGGRHVGVRANFANRITDAAIRPEADRQLPDPRDLLVHCAQEMNHLAGFLPALYERFGE
jgi:hypothetical protein